MKPQHWRQLEGITQTEAANILGTTVTTISRYEIGLRIPKESMILKYYDVTKGLVTANDFYELRRAYLKKRAKKNKRR